MKKIFAGLSFFIVITLFSGCENPQFWNKNSNSNSIQDSNSEVETGEVGLIRACQYTMGEEKCGKCYCLENEKGNCDIIDISQVGDLLNFVGRKIFCDGTRDQKIIQSTRTCPRAIKLFRVVAE